MTLSALDVILLICVGSTFLGLSLLYIRRFSTLLKNKGIPTIGTFPKHKKLMKQHLKIKPGARLIDLGCGTGGALRFFAKEYACSHLDGVDLNRIAIMYGNRIHKRKGYTTISLKTQNMFDVDLSGYDYVYLFLMPNIMQDVEHWLEKHLPHKTIVICLAFKLPHRKPYHIIEDTNSTPKVFLYKKP